MFEKFEKELKRGFTSCKKFSAFQIKTWNFRVEGLGGLG